MTPRWDPTDTPPGHPSTISRRSADDKPRLIYGDGVDANGGTESNSEVESSPDCDNTLGDDNSWDGWHTFEQDVNLDLNQAVLKVGVAARSRPEPASSLLGPAWHLPWR